MASGADNQEISIKMDCMPLVEAAASKPLVMSLIPGVGASVLHCLEHTEAVGSRLALTRADGFLSKSKG